MPRRVDASRFAMVPRSDVPRSAFDIQHSHKTTIDGSQLVPIYVNEVLPGDSVRLRMACFSRLTTALRPIMDNLVFESFFFYVPNRLLWSNWERFMGEQASPTDSTSFLVPYVEGDEVQFGQGTIYDYFGVTVNFDVAAVLRVSALPFRAYNLIWNEWFRDQDLQTKVVENSGDGPDATTDYNLKLRNKKHDYFTSCRPWPQKPSAQLSMFSINPALSAGQNMTLPYGLQIGAPVSGLGVLNGSVATAGAADVAESGGRVESYPGSNWRTLDDQFVMRVDSVSTGNPDVRVLVNDMRMAVMIQHLLEVSARGGTRYSELVRAHFGVISPDARLQRPEYLGGGRSFINVNAVSQTSASGVAGTTTHLGDQAGIGSVAISDHGFSQSFTEHGWIIGLINVRGDLTYQQGVNRMWFRRTRYDFYWPSLAHLGEQAVMLKELYCVGNSSGTVDNTVFGYQERWSEYKYLPSRTSNYMRSTTPGTLDVWHLGQKFLSAPALNSTFVTDDTATSLARTQVTTGFAGEQLLVDTLFDVRMVRPMPMFSIPGVGARL